MIKVKKSDKGDFYKRQIVGHGDLAVVDAKDAIKVCFFFLFDVSFIL